MCLDITECFGISDTDSIRSSIADTNYRTGKLPINFVFYCFECPEVTQITVTVCHFYIYLVGVDVQNAALTNRVSKKVLCFIMLPPPHKKGKILFKADALVLEIHVCLDISKWYP